jgi:hypothetical protein
MPKAAFPKEAPDNTGYDPDALFHQDGPINPLFVNDAVRTLVRAMPLIDQTEPRGWVTRRMYTAMRALAALHPRDEIELMLGVQALCAYQAASALWRAGMNLRYPPGDSTRHITTAATAARTFDTMLKALERRQAKPLVVPPGRPAPRHWPEQDPAAVVDALEARCRQGEDDPEPVQAASSPPVVWTAEAVILANTIAENARTEDENQGLDLANTPGIRSDGSIIMPEYPTPEQDAYIARRIALRIKREWAENQRNGIKGNGIKGNGIKGFPKIRPLRTGDLVP